MNIHAPEPPIVDIESPSLRRLAIIEHAARGARQTLRELNGEGAPVEPELHRRRKARGIARKGDMDFEQPSPLPAVPTIPKRFRGHHSNVTTIVRTVLARHDVTRRRLLKHDKADVEAMRARHELCYRLLRYGKVMGLPLSPAQVGRLLERDRTSVLYGAARYAADRGFEL